MSVHFAHPPTNIAQLGLLEGMKVADLGSGTGHYALAAAGTVGKNGRVYAIDVQEDLLKHLKDSASTRRIYNLETIWGDVEKPLGTSLREASIDAVIVSNLLFQLPNKPALAREVRRILKPGGKVLVIDWAGAYGGMGPTPELVYSEHEAEALFIGAGFHKLKSLRAGPHHYGIVFNVPSIV